MSTFSNEQGEPVTKDQLKILALRERVAQLTAEYEDKIADLRVELTFVSAELESLKNGEGEEPVEVPTHPSEDPRHTAH